eukprot:CAMPEP_0202741710 /NCGR_PEP_ID=MMETSP1388-20130828/4504_1 /ASSEMBLY_ACC=CAM_ASM_000864 /TAXON_ID=37098 /ORGANISM="Isochrysis sp, Strain CCMP1244" /LENGTH=151 /DNA_ID=CAMNT_0049408565 /DNA_START=84 /DNA_END=536 /DNA_ORIENTATION=+
MSPRLARRQAAHQAEAANPRSPPTAAQTSAVEPLPASARDTPEGSEGGPHDGHGNHTEEKDSLADLKVENVLELVLREGFCAPTIYRRRAADRPAPPSAPCLLPAPRQEESVGWKRCRRILPSARVARAAARRGTSEAIVPRLKAEGGGSP